MHCGQTHKAQGVSYCHVQVSYYLLYAKCFFWCPTSMCWAWIRRLPLRGPSDIATIQYRMDTTLLDVGGPWVYRAAVWRCSNYASWLASGRCAETTPFHAWNRSSMLTAAHRIFGLGVPVPIDGKLYLKSNCFIYTSIEQIKQHRTRATCRPYKRKYDLQYFKTWIKGAKPRAIAVNCWMFVGCQVSSPHKSLIQLKYKVRK
jgi:hypothetical protein